MNVNADREALYRDTAFFLTRYEANAALRAEQKGWNTMLGLLATDTDQGVRISVQDGQAIALCESDSDGLAGCDVVVRADFEILSDILRLRRLPNEPYLFGELLVTGNEADFLRLDYIVTSLELHDNEARP